MRLSAAEVDCRVFTFKEGPLSPVGHDLELRVERLTLDVADDLRSLEARFDARSLVVVTARARDAPVDALSAADRRKIEQQIAHDVLDARRHPEVIYRATSITPAAGGGYEVDGELALHGQTRRLRLASRPDGARQKAEVWLHQPDYGIRPFTALFGALRVRADVRVRLALVLPGRA